jgi:uncharacterized protein
MALTDQIQSDLTAAMKARDKATTTVLRAIVAAVKNARVAEGAAGEVDDEQAVELLAKEAKKRQEAIDAAEQAGRDELAAAERAELEVIRRYLPEGLSDEELAAVVDEAIAEIGASGPSDFGTVMGTVMPKVKGRADGKQVNAMVRERLGA